MAEIDIRPITDLDQMRAAEEVQRQIWNMDDLEVLDVHTLHALQHNGAALLGAFAGETLIGLSLGVLGTIQGAERRDKIAAARLKIHSLMTGVAPAYQGQGVGYRLKLAQRDFALRIGVRLVTWTFDPLESRNAFFNISKLGAICRRYYRDFYGELSGVNAGLPSDRFEVEWWVTGNRAEGRVVKERRPLSLDALLGGGAVLINEATFNAAGLPTPPPNYVSRPSTMLLAEIPADFQAIKEADMELARRWRRHGRSLFEALFQSNYVVTDFVSSPGPAGHQRSFYLLTHQNG
jgi:predicted GNAT superfamily acetyltransferase